MALKGPADIKAHSPLLRTFPIFSHRVYLLWRSFEKCFDKVVQICPCDLRVFHRLGMLTVREGGIETCSHGPLRT